MYVPISLNQYQFVSLLQFGFLKNIPNVTWKYYMNNRLSVMDWPAAIGTSGAL